MNGAVKQTKNMQLEANTNTRRNGKEKVDCVTFGNARVEVFERSNFSRVYLPATAIVTEIVSQNRVHCVRFQDV
jgi:hypothetical protein